MVAVTKNQQNVIKVWTLASVSRKIRQEFRIRRNCSILIHCQRQAIERTKIIIIYNLNHPTTITLPICILLEMNPNVITLWSNWLSAQQVSDKNYCFFFRSEWNASKTRNLKITIRGKNEPWFTFEKRQQVWLVRNNIMNFETNSNEIKVVFI